MKEPFYCFKFNPETYKWTRYEITEYTLGRYNSRGIHYIITHPKIANMKTTNTNSSRFDKFIDYKVYTFIDDLERAKKIAYDTILVKMGNLEREHNKLHNMLDSLQEEA